MTLRKFAVVAAYLVTGSLSGPAAKAQMTTPVKVHNVALVHGAWADGSSWSEVIARLHAAGLSVTAVQNPPTSLADSLAETKRALALQGGPTVLVGHSWNGMLVSEAGTDPKVTALVYVAARASDAREDSGAASPATQSTALAFTGRGTQIYSCQNTGSAYTWVLKGPDAQLFNAAGQVVGRHFFGPQWQANDGSRISGQLLVASTSPDGGQENMPWLVLRAHIEQADGIFGHVRIITRTDTHGGAAPSAPCGPQQNGQTMSKVYSATYTFFSGPEGT
jgi:pimeloyl-ACP methyl ester carboxylesterase